MYVSQSVKMFFAKCSLLQILLFKNCHNMGRILVHMGTYTHLFIIHLPLIIPTNWSQPPTLPGGPSIALDSMERKHIKPLVYTQ